jgi:hypothetical protein
MIITLFICMTMPLSMSTPLFAQPWSTVIEKAKG